MEKKIKENGNMDVEMTKERRVRNEKSRKLLSVEYGVWRVECMKKKMVMYGEWSERNMRLSIREMTKGIWE